MSDYERGFSEAIEKAVEVVRPTGIEAPACCNSCARGWFLRHEIMDAIRALSPSHDTVRVPKPKVQERWTICEDCGKGIVDEDANWMDDGSSYCKSCRPRSRAITEGK